MQLPKSFLEELRMRLPISQIVRKKVDLKAKSIAEFVGLCPFHKEKTPSFTVSDNKGFYHCFGCGAHGDIIKFNMDVYGLSFMETVTQLASMAGLSMPKMTANDIKHEAEVKSLYQVMEIATNWFEAQLYASAGQGALQYLQKRGIPENIIKLFRLGFAPDHRQGLKQALSAKGISEQSMLDTGLIIKNDRGDIYDRFRNRIIFPIIDIRSKVIAFGGRILGDGQPKYLNSPETELFKKGQVLYNENLSRNVAHKTGKLVVVEGYIDAISLYSAGVNSVVAPLGTALTETQLKMLWYMAKEPVLCMDGDSAGQNSMERAARLALPLLTPGLTLKFAQLPSGMDPDDYVKSYGVDKMRKVLINALPLSKFIWQNELSRSDISTPERRSDLEKRLDDLILTLKNARIAANYRKFFHEKLYELGHSIRPKDKKTNDRRSLIGAFVDIDLSKLEGSESLILTIILNNPSILSDHNVYDEFTNIEFYSNKLDKLRNAILEITSLGGAINRDILRMHLENAGFKHDISVLDNVRFSFFGEPCDEHSILKLGWKWSLNVHNIANLKFEIFNIKNGMLDNSEEEKVTELYNQIGTIEKENSGILQNVSDYIEAKN